MAVTAIPYRWAPEEFLLAWEAGAFHDRAELIDGEVWAVPIGRWHGETAARVIRAMPKRPVPRHHRVTACRGLAAGPGLLGAARAEAEPVAHPSPRLSRWSPSDVLLVVEVSDETLDLDHDHDHDHDLGRKATLYAQAGYPRYWSVTRDGVRPQRTPVRRATVSACSPGAEP